MPFAETPASASLLIGWRYLPEAVHEIVTPIAEYLQLGKTSLSSQGFYFRTTVLQRKFHIDSFPGFKLDFQTYEADVDGLRLGADDVAFRFASGGIVAFPVFEGAEIEIGIQLAVDAAQEVEVELGGDAGRIVVGVEDDGRVFF